MTGEETKLGSIPIQLTPYQETFRRSWYLDQKGPKTRFRMQVKEDGSVYIEETNRHRTDVLRTSTFSNLDEAMRTIETVIEFYRKPDAVTNVPPELIEANISRMYQLHTMILPRWEEMDRKRVNEEKRMEHIKP